MTHLLAEDPMILTCRAPVLVISRHDARRVAVLPWMLAVGLLCADATADEPDTKPVGSSSAHVHDYAGKFTKDAITQAETAIEQLKSRHQRELVVETYPAIPESMRDDFATKGKSRFFEDWASNRFKDQKISGVGVLICMDPRHLQVEVGNETQKKLFTAADRDELIRHLAASLRDDRFDEGLVRAAGFVLKRFDEHEPVAGAMATGTQSPVAAAAASASTQPMPRASDPKPGDQSAVFSNVGDARQILFFFDVSGELPMKLASLKNELIKAINALAPAQSFNIVLVQDQQCVALDKEQLLIATPENKRKAYKFIDDVTISDGDPVPALIAAFQQHPQLIYLVSDGDFPDNRAALEKIAELNKEHKTRIDTIAFMHDRDDNDADFLKLLAEVAKANGGTYRRVADDELKE